ncbi:Protein root UVB sensitive 1, chloroplastic [Porphyridium purpureum]|uniref:Protein root UVB sensitive 1, chloroplastic n=1 Tax=Porphyridium purpureum TaxID=35688 RepID=A0A5J4YLU1_PORPP|nr:Protein root UVB sensitive 1, chloroplastic [Porphyridium purpureum]|eukprot:POR8881..scf249_10
MAMEWGMRGAAPRGSIGVVWRESKTGRSGKEKIGVVVVVVVVVIVEWMRAMDMPCFVAVPVHVVRQRVPGAGEEAGRLASRPRNVVVASARQRQRQQRRNRGESRRSAYACEGCAVEADRARAPCGGEELRRRLVHARAGAGERTAVVYVPAGMCRLLDHEVFARAVSACVAQGVRLVPVYVLSDRMYAAVTGSAGAERPLTERDRDEAGCINDLQSRLQRMHSDLLLLSPSQVGASALEICGDFARRIGAIWLFGAERSAAREFDNTAWALHRCKAYARVRHRGEPVPSPLRMPALPTDYGIINMQYNAVTLAQRACLRGLSNGSRSETRALARLQHILRLGKSRASFASIMDEFRREITIGALSCRTVLSLYTRHGVAPHAPFTQLRPSPNLGSLAFAVSGVVAANSMAGLLSRSAHAATASKRRIVADIFGPRVNELEWNDETRSFDMKKQVLGGGRDAMAGESDDELALRRFLQHQFALLKHAFIPEDVSPDYYSFSAWRFVQRIMSATVGVFGTQALLLAVGIKSGKIGQAATVSWIIKDGLGRVGKMAWAGGKGKHFDVDPKRWRFRSALMYAVGNGLEIITQIFPASFVVLASLATTLKQTSMLTASATRNAMYRSFGGSRDNMGNITAKGEAQIVVADLIGMTFGVRLSKSFNLDRTRVLAAYVVLSSLDIAAIYAELRQVVFRTFNPERACLVIKEYLRSSSDGDGKERGKNQTNKQWQIMSPEQVNKHERIFLPPQNCPWGTFTSVSKMVATPQELESLLSIFGSEKFMVNYERDTRAKAASLSSASGGAVPNPYTVRIVLHKDARSPDVLCALMTRAYLIRLLRSERRSMDLQRRQSTGSGTWLDPVLNMGGRLIWNRGATREPELSQVESERRERLKQALQNAKKMQSKFKQDAAKAGWGVEHLVFAIPERGSW